MASINLDSEKFKLGSASHTIEKGKERKSHRSVKASEFLFTPLRTKARKQHDETIVPSSPDEHLDASRKTTVLPEENKGTERRKILVFSSPSSEEEKPSNLKACISSDKDKTHKKMTVLPEENKVAERRKKLVFSSSSSGEEKPSNLKACISSDDKTLKKITVLPEENKGTERGKKVVLSSSSSSEEKASNLKACINSDKEKTLQTMKPRKGVSSSKKKQLLPRHTFILN
jgi:cell fate regulator YaaT (PSP1 superfamily)